MLRYDFIFLSMLSMEVVKERYWLISQYFFVSQVNTESECNFIILDSFVFYAAGD